ncbi:topoisomerase VI, partial [Tanacetum coccineum]
SKIFHYMRQMAVITPYAQFMFRFVSETLEKVHAERLIGEMGPDFTPKTAVKSLTSQQIVRMHQLFRQAKFDDPSGDESTTFAWV